MTLKVFYCHGPRVLPTWIETHNLDKQRDKMNDQDFETYIENMAHSISRNHKNRRQLKIELRHLDKIVKVVYEAN
jgi:hypothetical protein